MLVKLSILAAGAVDALSLDRSPVEPIYQARAAARESQEDANKPPSDDDDHDDAPPRVAKKARTGSPASVADGERERSEEGNVPVQGAREEPSSGESFVAVDKPVGVNAEGEVADSTDAPSDDVFFKRRCASISKELKARRTWRCRQVRRGA